MQKAESFVQQARQDDISGWVTACAKAWGAELAGVAQVRARPEGEETTYCDKYSSSYR